MKKERKGKIFEVRATRRGTDRTVFIPTDGRPQPNQIVRDPYALAAEIQRLATLKNHARKDGFGIPAQRRRNRDTRTPQ